MRRLLGAVIVAVSLTTRILSYCCLVTGPVVGLLIARALRMEGTGGAGAILFFITFLMITLFSTYKLSLLCYTFGKKLNTPTAASALRGDRRAPILWLRSFLDDEAVFVPEAEGEARAFGGRRTFEETVVAALARYGPVIAIGRPGEWIPPAGASRLYVGDDWREVIRGYIARSQKVFLVLAMTKGLSWELEAVLGSQWPTKVVIVLPPISADEMARRWDNFRALVSRRCPWILLPPLLSPRALFALFDHQWHFRYLEHERMTRDQIQRKHYTRVVRLFMKGYTSYAGSDDCFWSISDVSAGRALRYPPLSPHARN
jgi:hypothetical protein